MIGKHPSLISQMEKDDVRVPQELAARLAEEYEINLNWFFTGSLPGMSRLSVAEEEPSYAAFSDAGLLAEMKRRLSQPRGCEHPEAQVLVVDHPERFEELEGQERYRAVPFLGGAIAAGAGRIVEEEIEGYVVIHESVLDHPQRTVAVRIAGESMAPVYLPRSIVAVDLTQRDPARLLGQEVCARTGSDDEAAIKVLTEACPDGIVLESYNPAYAPIEVSHLEVEEPIIGQVVWAWQDRRRPSGQ